MRTYALRASRRMAVAFSTCSDWLERERVRASPNRASRCLVEEDANSIPKTTRIEGTAVHSVRDALCRSAAGVLVPGSSATTGGTPQRLPSVTRLMA